jgi:hypothetical protein
MISMLNIFMLAHTKKELCKCAHNHLWTRHSCCVVCPVGSVFKGERENTYANAMMLLFSFGPTFFEECSSGVIVNSWGGGGGDVHFLRTS